VADNARPAPDDAAGTRERRQARGRPRDRQATVPARESDFDAAAEISETPSDLPKPDQGDELDEDVDTLSDWNAPSWNEIIASLYRPP
jgi:hypothetical protein